jgi:hypothetical protein
MRSGPAAGLSAAAAAERASAGRRTRRKIGIFMVFLFQAKG